MNWTRHELDLIHKHKDLIERGDLVGLLQTLEKEDEIGEGTSNAGLKITIGILMVEPGIPFYLQVDWGMVYLALAKKNQVIEGASYDGVLGDPRSVKDVVMHYFDDPGFTPNPYIGLPKDKLKALVDRAEIVWES